MRDANRVAESGRGARGARPTALELCGALGVVSLVSYCAALVLSPLAYPGYDWMSQAVSDLSAANAPSRELWDQLSSLYGSCGIVSVMATCVYAADNRVGNRLLRAGIYLFTAMQWLSHVGYRLFPLTDGGKELASFADFMHVYVVTAGVVVLSIASLACIIASGARRGGVRSLSRWATIALALMFVGAVGTGLVPPRFFGIVERFSVLSAVGFNAVLGVYLLKGMLR